MTEQMTGEEAATLRSTRAPHRFARGRHARRKRPPVWLAATALALGSACTAGRSAARVPSSARRAAGAGTGPGGTPAARPPTDHSAHAQSDRDPVSRHVDPGGATEAGIPAHVVEVRLPTGVETLRWAEPGSVGLFHRNAEPRPETLVALPLRGGRRLVLRAEGPRVLRANGAVQWVRLTGLSEREAKSLLTQHRGSLVAVGDDGRLLLRRSVLRALTHLHAHRLVVVLESYRPANGSLARLGRLGRRLSALVLASARVTDYDLRPLGRLRSLTSLMLADTPIGDGGLRTLARLPHLAHLHLSWARIDNRGLERLARMTQLRSLRLQAKRISAEGLAHLASLPRLRHLDLGESPIADDGLARLARMTALRSLVLRHCPLRDPGLAHLARLTALVHLSLEWTRITHRGLAHLARLRRLVWLNLSTTRLTNTGLAAIAPLSGLVYLNLSGSLTSNPGLASLRRLPRLRGLWLGPTNTGDAGLQHLASLRRLRVLDLRGGLLTGRGLSQLAPLTRLRWIDLSETGVKQEALDAFRRAHPGCRIRRVKLVRRAPARPAIPE